MNGLIALGHNNLIRVGGKCSEELKHYSVQNKAQRILESTELKGGDVQNCGELNCYRKRSSESEGLSIKLIQYNQPTGKELTTYLRKCG